MTRSFQSLLRAGRDQVLADLRADRYLRYLLVLTVALSAFWFWHRIPNFATRDEITRVLDGLVPYARVIEEPSLESIQSGFVWGRAPFGATGYLYALVFLPIVVAALVLGHGDAFSAIATPTWEFGHYATWAETPEWVWTWTIAAVRLTNVVFALGSVYLTYRLGVLLKNRQTGRLAGLLLTLSFGFLTIAHEGGEDMPALFFVLLALVLLVRYIRTGAPWSFLTASAAGGLAIGFKLTAVPIIGAIAVAWLLYSHRTSGPGYDRLRPRLVAVGAIIGLLVILFSFPTTLAGRFDLVVERIAGGSVSRATHPTGPDAPILWWFLRGYLSGLGLPLFIGSLAGVMASLWQIRNRPEGTRGVILVLSALIGYLLLFSTWHDFRVHHLLPTFPFFALLLAWSVSNYRARAPQVARGVIAVVILTSGIYAGIGVAGYADMPRDNAVDWLETNAADEDTVEVYRLHFQDTGVPHGMNVTHAFGAHGTDEQLDPCPEYIQLTYRDLLYRAEGTYLRNGPVRSSYLSKLLEGEYGYEIAAEFGPRPPNFVPERATPGNYTDLLRYGVVPQTDQYADEQELRPNQYTVILEQTGECDRSRYPPF